MGYERHSTITVTADTHVAAAREEIMRVLLIISIIRGEGEVKVVVVEEVREWREGREDWRGEKQAMREGGGLVKRWHGKLEVSVKELGCFS